MVSASVNVRDRAWRRYFKFSTLGTSRVSLQTSPHKFFKKEKGTVLQSTKLDNYRKKTRVEGQKIFFFPSLAFFPVDFLCDFVCACSDFFFSTKEKELSSLLHALLA